MHKDPYQALGICDALRDAELLAGAVQDAFEGRRPMPDALADFEARRNEASAADYDANIAEARFTPPAPAVLGLRAAVRDRPAEATRLLKARMGMIDPATFFNPGNLERLMRDAPSPLATDVMGS